MHLMCANFNLRRYLVGVHKLDLSIRGVRQSADIDFLRNEETVILDALGSFLYCILNFLMASLLTVLRILWTTVPLTAHGFGKNLTVYSTCGIKIDICRRTTT